MSFIYTVTNIGILNKKEVFLHWYGPGCSVGIATDCGLEGPGSNDGGDEIFRALPDRPWGPPSLL